MISDEQVTEVLRLTGEFFRQSIRRRESDLAVGEGALLGILRMRGETTAGELCEILRVGSGRIANLLKHTEAKGYIVRKKSEEDRRKVLVSITPSGLRESEKRGNRIRSNLRRTLERLGEEETENILRLLRKIIEQNNEEIKEGR
ncbi:MAG: winged helix-turn-helix transcriptional regulator [Clostridia bacterium]|nr:winged helix-turn-helix transcriptional regulator [Clostridia bacterium]